MDDRTAKETKNNKIIFFIGFICLEVLMGIGGSKFFYTSLYQSIKDSGMVACIMEIIGHMQMLISFGILMVVDFKAVYKEHTRPVKTLFVVIMLLFSFLLGIYSETELEEQEQRRKYEVYKTISEPVPDVFIYRIEDGEKVEATFESTLTIREIYYEEVTTADYIFNFPLSILQYGVLDDNDKKIIEIEVEKSTKDKSEVRSDILSEIENAGKESTIGEADGGGSVKSETMNRTEMDFDGIEKKSKNIDVVVVFDASSSMKSVDEHLNARNILTRMADMADRPDSQSEEYNVDFAIIPFAESADCLVTESGENMWRLDGVDALENIKEATDKLEYDGRDTDIAQALVTCKDVLEEMSKGDEDALQIVLFITDGLIDFEVNNKFPVIIESNDELQDLRDSFPTDCYFLAIVPNDSCIVENVKYDEGKITSYMGDAVPKEYHNDIVEVVSAVQNFVSGLRENQPKDHLFPARIQEIDFNAPNALEEIDKIFIEFSEIVFNTDVIEKKDINIQEGYEFYIPEVVQDIKIHISPSVKNVQEQQEIVEEILKGTEIRLLRNGEEYKFEKVNLGNAISIKIPDLQEGNYEIVVDTELPQDVDIHFMAYGNLSMNWEESDITAILGEKITLNANIEDDYGEVVSDEHLEYIDVQQRKLADNSEKEITVQGKISFQFIPEKVGNHYLSLKMQYDDSLRKLPCDGVSSFHEELEAVHIYVPEVIYEIKEMATTYDIDEKIILEVGAYSEVAGEKVPVSAEACANYLDDNWSLNIDGKRDEQLKLDKEKNVFYIEKAFTEVGIHSIEFINTGNDIVQPLEMQIQIVRPDAPEVTKKFPTELTIECYSWDDFCRQTIDISSWLKKKTNYEYCIGFQENEHFDVEPATVASNENMEIYIKRKTDMSFHLPRSDKLVVIVMDHKGDEYFSREILVEEKLHPVAVVIVVVLAILVILILKWIFSKVGNMKQEKVNITVYLTSGRVESVQIEKPKKGRYAVGRLRDGSFFKIEETDMGMICFYKDVFYEVNDSCVHFTKEADYEY